MTNPLTAAICGALDAREIADGVTLTQVPGLRIGRTHGRVAPRHMAYRPSLCIVAQGTKEVLAGARTITYGDMQSLVVTVDVPVLSQVVEASPDRPFVGGTLALNPDIIFEVAGRMSSTRALSDEPASGLTVADIDEQITASFVRLVELVDKPEAIDVLFPEIMREIAYWLLSGPTGQDVARMVMPRTQPARIAKAIAQLKHEFEGPINVAELARTAGMSLSAFHQHFKALTSMSPLQYQKHLRLLEAKRLMLSDGERAGAAAFTVGYESVSQFSREYARMFGSSPSREPRASGRAALPAARPLPPIHLSA